MEELVVEPDDHLTQPGARRDADEHPHAGDQQRPFHVVPAERRVCVAERLERRNLRPLQRQRARQRDVEDERRDARKISGSTNPNVWSWASSFSSVQCDS